MKTTKKFTMPSTPEEWAEMSAQWEREHENRSRAWTPERRRRQSERLKRFDVRLALAVGRTVKIEHDTAAALRYGALPVDFVEKIVAPIRQSFLASLHELRETAEPDQLAVIDARDDAPRG
jgi:hypothetical protein